MCGGALMLQRLAGRSNTFRLSASLATADNAAFSLGCPWDICAETRLTRGSIRLRGGAQQPASRWWRRERCG